MWIVPAVFAISLLLTGMITPSYAAVGSNPVALEHIPDRFIVVFKNDVQADDFVNKHGVEKIKQYKHALKGVAVKGPPAKIDKIKDDPNVLFVEQDKRFSILTQSIPTGIDRIDAELNSYANIDGINDPLDVDVAIIDTGIDADNPDLNIAGGINFVGIVTGAWNDGNGHGTHVAGTVGAVDNNIGVVGVAPGAKLWAIKVLDNGGSGTLADVIQGIDWVTANSDVIDVANLSLGGVGSDDGNCGYSNGDALHVAICNSVAQGVVYVVAAGNSATNSASQIPAAYDEVITVSAVADFDGKPGSTGPYTCRYDIDDTLADFSNYGSDVDIAAPGVCIESTWKDGAYVRASGTSMASPHVAGAAALYILENGKPTNQAGVEQVKQGLVSAAIPQNSPDGFVDDSNDGYNEPLLNVASSSNNEPTHDVAVSSIVAPESAIEGDLITIDVTVSNQGDSEEAVTLTVTDDTESSTIGTANDILLSPGASSLHSFSWDTTFLSGDHTITAQVSSVSGENDLSDNSKSTSVNVIEKTHDVAVNNIDVPSSVYQGDVVNADVTVANLGSFDETFTVTLTDITDSQTIGQKTVSMTSGSTQVVTFNWSTNDSTEDIHNLEAEASVVSFETNISNNVKSKDVTVTAPNNEPASVTISNPSNGDTVNGKVTIVANPSGFSSGTTVKFYIDGALKKTLTSGPYEYGWHTKGQSTGSHGILVDAYDYNGKSASDSISIVIPEKGPAKGKNNAKGLLEDESAESLLQDTKQSKIIPTSFDSIISESSFVIEDVSPVADAGENQLVSVLDTVSLDGSGSSDADEDPLTYSWSLSVPDGSSAVLSDATAEMPTFDVDLPGIYTAELIVNDGFENSETASVTIETQNSEPVIEFDEQVVDEIVIVTEGLPKQVGIAASDVDGDELTISADGLPDFVTLETGAEDSLVSLETSQIEATLVIDPGFEDAGQYEIIIIVSDGSEIVSAEMTAPLTIIVQESTPESLVEYLNNQAENIDPENLQNLGQWVSEAARLHEHLVGTTSAQRGDYQEAFHNYINAGKEALSIGQFNDKRMIQELTKAQLRLDVKLAEMDEKEKSQTKITSAIEYTNQKRDLIKIRNHIATLESFLSDGEEKEKILDDLYQEKVKIHKAYFALHMQQNELDITDDEIKQITENIKNDHSSNSGSSDKSNNGKGLSGQSDNDGPKGKSSSDKSSSGKGNSGKSNNGNKGGNGKNK